MTDATDLAERIVATAATAARLLRTLPTGTPVPALSVYAGATSGISLYRPQGMSDIDAADVVYAVADLLGAFATGSTTVAPAWALTVTGDFEGENVIAGVCFASERGAS